MIITNFECEEQWNRGSDVNYYATFKIQTKRQSEIREIYENCRKHNAVYLVTDREMERLYKKENEQPIIFPEDFKLIYQDKNTILRVGDKVFMARPESGERFDREKGVMVCLLKALGFSTTDLLDLINTAHTKTTKKSKKTSKKR